jgi:glycosyltransferase involved in cell wall biosynthesis
VTGGPLRILFVCGADFRAPSEKQVLAFAEVLTRRGHEVAVSIGGDLASVGEEGAQSLERFQAWRHTFRGPRLAPSALAACSAFRPTLVHAFNPRLPVVRATSAYSELTGAPAFVHFEDDEWGLAGQRAGASLGRRAARRAARALRALQPSLWPLADESSLAWAERQAVAADALTPVLARHVEERLGRSCAVILPPVSGLGTTDRPPSRNELPLGDGSVVAYTGGIFGAHSEDFLIALRAVGRLRAEGREVRLVQTGRVARRFAAGRLARDAGIPPAAVSLLGYRPAAEVEELMSRAHVLVQPGAPSEFNRLRFPSKLAAYLASGTPTVTFAVGPGELFEDRVEVLKTHTGEAGELADRIAEVLDDGELRERLSRGGPAAAARLFDPNRCADALLEHYGERL